MQLFPHGWIADLCSEERQVNLKTPVLVRVALYHSSSICGRFQIYLSQRLFDMLYAKVATAGQALH